MKIRSAALLFALALAGFAGWTLFVVVPERPAEHATRVAAVVAETTALHEPVPVLGQAASGSGSGSGVEPVQTRNWARSFRESTDDLLLARELASAAVNGDGRAQYRLGRLLLNCEVYKRILAPYSEGGVAERIEFHLANSTFAEQSRAEFRRGALRCSRLFTEDPFADYDLPEEARDFRHWEYQAVESGDPLAVVNRALRSATDHTRSDDAEKERAFRASLLSDVRQVALYGDGAALYALGGMFSHPSVAADPEDGYAWIVAACESGYDCSNLNPDVGAGCVERGTCEPGQTFLDVLQRDLGAGKYAAIYANAQDIQFKIRTNDWDGLQQYLEVKD
jgi:hypothetical protein